MEAILKVEEYLAQSFDFTPQCLSDTVYNLFSDFTNDGINKLQETLKNEFGHLISDSELESGSQKIRDAFFKETDQNFQKLDKYLFQNVYQIPDEFVFPEDKVQLEINATEEKDLKLDDEIKSLIQQIEEEKFKTACLEQEGMELDKTTAEYSKMLQLFNTLDEIAVKNQFAGLDEVDSVGNDLNELKSLLNGDDKMSLICEKKNEFL